MKLRQLMAISMDNYRKNGLISHAIFFFLSLLAAAFLLLCLFYVDLFLIIVPLIAIPLFFASQVIVVLFREESYLTFGGFFNCFKNYFTPKFASTFRVIKSAIWSFVVYLVFAIIYGITINLSFYYTNYMGYADIFTEIANTQIASTADINEIYNLHKDFFNKIMIYMNVPSLFVSAISFIYLIGRNAIGLFDRLNNMGEPGELNKLAHNNISNQYRKEINGAFIKLNWPLFFLFTLGFAGGAVLGYYNLGSYNGVYTLGIALAILISFGIYGPFFLANNEAIYLSFKDRYAEEKNKVKGQLMNSIEEMMKKYQEQYPELNEDDEQKNDSDES